MRALRRIVVGGLVVALVAAGVGAYALVRRPEPGPPVEVRLERGLSTAAIAERLRQQDVIDSTLSFRLLAKVRGLEGRLQAGRFELRRGMGAQAALDVLAAGPRDKTVAVTIPEGYTVRQIAARVGDKTHITRAAFEQAVASGRVRAAAQPDGVTSLEGFLYPETYVVGERETAEALLARMVRTFDERTAALDWSGATSRGLSRYQAVVLASLVEREAKVHEDRTKIAAVIYNRLADGMRLQIDATVLYDLPAHKVPLRADLERDTPYNTYKRDGLPPTPIANPGIESMRAALEPAAIDALYYVVVDKSGRHGFARTYEEFQRLLKLRPPETRGRRAP